MTSLTVPLATPDPFSPFPVDAPDVPPVPALRSATNRPRMDPFDPFGDFGQTPPDQMPHEGWRADLLAPMLKTWTLNDLMAYMEPLGGLHAVDDRGHTVLMGVAGVDLPSLGGTAWVTHLVRAGAPVNHQAPDGHSALSWALQHERTDVAMDLIRAGAAPDQTNVPLMVRDHHRALVQGGRGSILHQALGFDPVTRALITAGAPLNTVNDQGESPLGLALLLGLSSATSLLAAGASVAIRQDGQPWMTVGLPQTSPDVLRALARTGLTPNETNAQGLTPLDLVMGIAIQFGHDRLHRRGQLLALLDVGADPHRPLAAHAGHRAQPLIDRLLHEDDRTIDWTSVHRLVVHHRVSLDQLDASSDHLGSRTLWERTQHLASKVPPDQQAMYQATVEFVELTQILDQVSPSPPTLARARL